MSMHRFQYLIGRLSMFFYPCGSTFTTLLVFSQTYTSLNGAHCNGRGVRLSLLRLSLRLCLLAVILYTFELSIGVIGSWYIMFTTFQTSTVGLRSPGGGESGDHSRPGRSSSSRRISTSNACVECRRRKIRCDGTQPCGQCQWYQHPEACNYSKPAQRVVPSRK